MTKSTILHIKSVKICGLLYFKACRNTTKYIMCVISQNVMFYLLSHLSECLFSSFGVEFKDLTWLDLISCKTKYCEMSEVEGDVLWEIFAPSCDSQL